MSTEADFTSAPELFLARQQQRYHAAPDRADELLAELLPQFEALPEPPPPALPATAFALLLCQLGIEGRRMAAVAGVIERALRWMEAGREPALLPRLCCAAARLRATQQQVFAATELLRRANAAMADGAPDKVAPATLAHTLGMVALLQGDPERALMQHRRALALFKTSGYGGPWVQVYARMAIVLRELGQHDERRQMLLEGRQLARAQRRFGEAANLCAGLVDMALEAGDLQAAAEGLVDGEALLDEGAVPSTASCRLALLGARARWLAASGRPGEACALLEPSLDRVAGGGGPRELLRNLDELSAWRLRAGEGAMALQLSRRAHALRLQLDREAAGRQALELRQRLELELAAGDQHQHAQRAAQAEVQQRRLQAALDQLQALQEELAERSRKASLGPLLAGVAHELNTPLGTALTALSSAAEQGQTLLQQLGAGAVGRQGLTSKLRTVLEAQQLALRCLGRAQELVGSYRPAHADTAAAAPLAQLVERAWRRALSAGHSLELRLNDGVGAPVWPGRVIEEVLVQLFQNVERHAYAPGEAGAVEVRAARPDEAALRLSVADQGRGIAAELLPRVFEPYVSTQFGRGRSGLGLFIAEAAVRQQLGGRLQVRSRPGEGSCFEIECPPAD